MIKTIAITTIVLTSVLCFAQPSVIFDGGYGQGYAFDEIATAVPILIGGYADGYASGTSVGDEQFLTNGGYGDGYASSGSLAREQVLINGGYGAGYSSGCVIVGSVPHLLGGYGPGYDMDVLRQPFYWTGTVGVGWNVGDNWDRGAPPTIDHLAIIPTNVPNFPSLNAGIFAIGDNPDGGSFVSGSLWIQQNATLTTRVNNKIQNYGIIRINGTMLVKRTNPDAFLNKGVIDIRPSGVLKIQPN